MPREWREHVRVITVEPILFFVSFATMLSGPPFQDLILKKICQEMEEIPREVCDNLSQHPKEEELVQPRATMLIMSRALIEAILPAIAAFWIGPWSDRTRRRKPLLIFPLAGYALSYALLSILMGFKSLPPEYFLLAFIPVAVNGGLVSTFTSLTCIVGDETQDDGPMRTLRLGYLQAFFIVGILAASLISSATVDAFGYQGAFLMSGFISLLALVLAVCIVKDRPNVPSSEETGSINYAGLMKEMIQTVFKERPNGGRSCIILCAVALASSIICYEGEAGLDFLYVREKFGWKMKDYTLYISVQISLSLFGTVFGVAVLSNKLNIPDAPFTASVFLMKVISSFVKAFATKPWLMYLSCGISIFGGITPPVLRSILSKSTPQEDLGKVFSLTSSLEALTPLASSPLYTLLYNNTLETFSGAVYILSAGIFFFDFVLLCIIGFIQLKYSKPHPVPIRDEAEST